MPLLRRFPSGRHRGILFGLRHLQHASLVLIVVVVVAVLVLVLVLRGRR
ncbi:MAG: hypothetical protein WB797_18525 [Nocardioides sp.]